MDFDNRPIGVFDSGFGGLTVAREIIKLLPEENIIYFGDTANCPYGPREPEEVRSFVLNICSWLISQNVKMIVIACNTATAAGLEAAQKAFDVPIIGVVEPGARAAARATHNRRVGVIATQGTVDSGVYTRAIRNIDAGITVFSTATPRFVEIAELGIQMAKGPIESYTSHGFKGVHPSSSSKRLPRITLIRCAAATSIRSFWDARIFRFLRRLSAALSAHNVKLISSATEAVA